VTNKKEAADFSLLELVEMIIATWNYHAYMYIQPPATNEQLVDCNAELANIGLKLPDDYAGFLKICNGYCHHGIEFYGTEIIVSSKYGANDIFTETKRHNNENNPYDYPVLWLGMHEHADFIIYEPKTRKYKVHYHDCCVDVKCEYNTFKAFFIGEAKDNWDELINKLVMGKVEIKGKFDEQVN
jgi:hypothetical protein